MKDEERTEVIDTFIRIGEKFLKANKHFHLEPPLARDTIQTIKELQKENKICEEIIIGEQQEINDLKKENEQLKAQIEKMKCCGNCENKKSKPTCFFCVKLKKWELAE